MKKVAILALLTSALFAGGATQMAQTPAVSVMPKENKFYAGAAFELQRVETFKYGPANSYGASLKAGYEYNKYFAFELRYAAGIKRKKHLKLDYYYGIFVKPQLPLQDFKLYTLLGYGKAKVTHNGLSHPNKETIKKGFSYGLGAEYKINNKLSAYVEALSLIDKSVTRVEGKYAIKVRTFGIGVLVKF